MSTDSTQQTGGSTRKTDGGSPAEATGERPAVGEILPADPGRQRMTLLVVLFVCAVGLWSVYDLRSRIDAAQAMTHVSVRSGAQAMIVAADDFFRMLAGWCAVLALYLGWLGASILRAGRFPVPGAKVIRDTRVVGGAPAMARGVLATVLAVVFLLATVLLPNQGGSMVRELLAGALAQPDATPNVVDPDAFPEPDPLFSRDASGPQSPPEPGGAR